MPTLSDPVAFELFGLTIRWYAILILTGLILALMLMRWLAGRRGLDRDFPLDAAPWVILAALVGARGYYLLLKWSYYLDHPSEAINIRLGGLTVHGAIVGGVLALWLYCRYRRQHFLIWADIVAAALPLGQAIGRWGNWANQEAFGRPTDLPWGLEIDPIHRPEKYAEFSTFHPTFLYESICDLLIAALLIWIVLDMPKRSFWREGDALWIYCVLYGLVRFAIERMRTDSLTIGPFPAAYWLSWALTLIGVVMFVGRRTIWNGTRVVDIEGTAPGGLGMTAGPSGTQPFVLLITAHVAMLGKQGLIDDAAVRVLAEVVDRVGGGSFEQQDSLSLLLELDARVDAQSPQGFAGASQVGRGVNELMAAYARVVLRAALLDLAGQLAQAREDLIDLAVQHVVTILPAYQQGLVAQPTTLAHLLGGVIGPLDRAQAKLQQSYALVNRSPLGAGALVSTGLPIDREEAAANAGFDGVIENTFDAVTAIDHLAAVTETLRSVVSPIQRLIREIATIYRTDPSSLLMHDASPTVRGELPQLRVVPAFEAFERLAVDVDAALIAVDRWLEQAPLEPLAETGGLLDRLTIAFETTGRLIERFLFFLNREVAFNRAYLANRANRNHATIGELADFLMLEEQVPPAQARSMATRVMAQLQDEGIETSGITSAMIDSAGMLILGRELGVEFESLSKYLAPRRFIERRAGLGGPAPLATRAWLTSERDRLAADRGWIAERRAALEAANSAMRSLATEEAR